MTIGWAERSLAGRGKHSVGRKGFSLLEVAVATSLAAVGLVSLLGILPVALRVSEEIRFETRIGHAVRQIVCELRRQPYRDMDVFGERLDLAELPEDVTVFGDLETGQLGVDADQGSAVFRISFHALSDVSIEDGVLVRIDAYPNRGPIRDALTFVSVVGALR